MRYFPAFIDLNDQPVLVIGGGEVAARKTELALSAGAQVTVVSPELCPSLHRLNIHHLPEHYRSDLLAGMRLCFACTDNETVNQQIYADCETANVLVNVVDSQPLCRFITPSIIDREPLQIAIASGGSSPVLVRLLREKLEAELSPKLGELADFAGRMRGRIKQTYNSLTERRQLWERFFPLAMNAEDDNQREQWLQVALEGRAVEGELIELETSNNPDDITLGQLRRMQQVDLVIYQGNVSQVLELSRRDAEKEPGDKALAEAKAAAGQRVLWLYNPT